MRRLLILLLLLAAAPAVGARLEAFEPALARDEAALRVDVEEEVVPAVLDEPVPQGQRLRVVRARMADEDPRMVWMCAL